MTGLANEWPITKEWIFDPHNHEKTRESMLKIIGKDKEVGVYSLPKKFNKHISNVYSFA